VTSGLAVGRDPATGQGIAIRFADGVITGISSQAPAADEHYLSAGLVDVQVNGYAGLDLNDGALEAPTVVALSERLAREGITTFAPTLITASEASILAALLAIAAARRGSQLVREMVPFIHVEGPSISPRDGPRGAHPLAHVRAPSLAEFARWQEAADGLVGLVTLCPTYPEAADYIASLSRAGVLVAIGHTDATPAQIHAASAAGARLSTHLGNGAAATLPRHPNFIWAQLADDRLTASFISDGFHLPADTFRAMLRAKGLERAILVSDAAALGGMPPGRYRAPIGGDVEVSPEGRLGIAGTPYLAGAGHLLTQNVVQAMRMAGVSLADALRLATANPGALAGGRGRLEVGARADLIRFRHAPGAPALEVVQSFVAGREIAR
jgi:N-acetylglucosamine-6-phosphate deacetylase